MVFTPAELDNQIAQLQRGIARRKREIADMEPRAGWGTGYARALSEKREALAYHERELETIRAQRAEWGKGSAARAESGMGRYRFVTNCIGSTYEDISAMKETATGVSRATFAKALGPEQWKWVQKSLGYDRDFSISRDWHVGYDKGTYRGIPAYWLTHSGIEWIFTLDGEQGKSLGRSRGRGSRSSPAKGPLRVWHGTGHTFHVPRAPAFFTTSREGAAWFARERSEDGTGRVVQFQIEVSRPATKDDLIRVARDAGVQMEEDPYFYAPEIRKHSRYGGDNPLDLVYIPRVRQALLKAGFDGVRAWDLLEADEIEAWITLRDDQARPVRG